MTVLATMFNFKPFLCFYIFKISHLEEVTLVWTTAWNISKPVVEEEMLSENSQVYRFSWNDLEH